MKITDTICAGRDMRSLLTQALSAISGDKRYKVTIKEHNARSLDQNALMWLWLAQMADAFAKRGAKNESGEPVTKEDMHDLMRHKFLGYISKKVGSTELEPQLISTTTLPKRGDPNGATHKERYGMQEYLTDIDAWAIDHGVFLTHIEDSEWMKYREAQAA